MDLFFGTESHWRSVRLIIASHASDRYRKFATIPFFCVAHGGTQGLLQWGGEKTQVD